jgi:release factor glutamine methyltransferase
MTTVADRLRRAKALGVDRLDAQLLLAHTLARPRSWLIAHDDAVIGAGEASAFDAALARRAAGEPLAYVVGEKEFHGLALRLSSSVLVPRPETELLVDWALELLAGSLSCLAEPRVVDLGTGSGAIALAVKHGHAGAAVLATDVSADALAVARGNADRLGLAIAFEVGSWWAAVANRRFHLALSNPPYIAGDDPHLAALHHEPTLALTPGGDGLGALLCIVAGAHQHLEPGGWLLLEHGHDQAEAVQALLREHGFGNIETRRDLAGLPRCSGAHR